MADKNNKVKYNLKNAHYALLSITEDGTVSYGTPVALPGSVSISLDANGEPENFYADGIAYYVINNNMGYDGDLELALGDLKNNYNLDNIRVAKIARVKVFMDLSCIALIASKLSDAASKEKSKVA